MEYQSALKRNKRFTHEEIWRKRKCILLCARGQSEKATYCMSPLHDVLERHKYGDSEKMSGWLAGVRGERVGGLEGAQRVSGQ